MYITIFTIFNFESIIRNSYKKHGNNWGQDSKGVVGLANAPEGMQNQIFGYDHPTIVGHCYKLERQTTILDLPIGVLFFGFPKYLAAKENFITWIKVPTWTSKLYVNNQHSL